MNFSSITALCFGLSLSNTKLATQKARWLKCEIILFTFSRLRQFFFCSLLRLTCLTRSRGRIDMNIVQSMRVSSLAMASSGVSSSACQSTLVRPIRPLGRSVRAETAAASTEASIVWPDELLLTAVLGGLRALPSRSVAEIGAVWFMAPVKVMPLRSWISSSKFSSCRVDASDIKLNVISGRARCLSEQA